MKASDLDKRVRGLVDRGASPQKIYKDLDRIATAAEKRLRGYKQPTPLVYEDQQLRDRVGRILYYLHHRAPAQGATDADVALYKIL
jgi:hypothetical protein